MKRKKHKNKNKQKQHVSYVMAAERSEVAPTTPLVADDSISSPDYKDTPNIDSVSVETKVAPRDDHDGGYRSATAWYLFTTLLIMFPVLGRVGQIFLADTVWPRVFSVERILSNGFTANAPIELILGYLSLQFTPALTQKVFLFAILFAVQFFMYAFLWRRVGYRFALAGGFLYLFNPFMYERFMAGQWFVVLGFAFFPLLLKVFERYRMLKRPIDLFIFAATLAVYPLISLHVAYIAYALLAFYLLVERVIYASGLRSIRALFSLGRKQLLSLLAVFVMVFLVNLFWLKSFFAVGGTIAPIDVRDFAAFKTVADMTLGAYANVALQYGFWHEGVILPKDIFLYWWVSGGLLIMLAIVGLIRESLRKSILAITFLFAIIPVGVIATGFSSHYSELVTRFLIEHVPGFRGLRDTAKLIGVISFVIACYAPIGTHFLVRILGGGKRLLSYAALIFLLMLGFSTSFTWVNAAMGQIRTAEYPASWSTADELLLKDQTRKQVLVFPWVGYMQFDWAGGQLVANPSKGFFSFDTQVSSSVRNTILDQKYMTEFDPIISRILDVPSERKDQIRQLKSLDVTHVILFKANDWRRYLPFLYDGEYFELIGRYDEVLVFKVL